MKKYLIAPVALVWVCLTLWAWLAPAESLSVSERRPLQQMPAISTQSLLDGSFTKKFESYTLDQFPLRDSFRTLKSLSAYGLFLQKDNNGIYIQDGYGAKLEYPLSAPSVSHALKRFSYLYETYLQNTDCSIFLTVIPDKGYYLAEPNGYPAMDYKRLLERLQTGMPWAEFVDITAALDITDYYRTDTHWRQEKLTEVAERLCSALGVRPLQDEPIPTLATQQFYGVYYGQAALPMKAESLFVVENALLKDCRVYLHETKAYTGIYDLQRLSGADPYDVYLSGPQAVLTIENPSAATDRELVIFRDSFGSSLAPLLVQDYAKVTLVDIRYVSSALLGQYLTFHNQDVLFAYSTLILNNSASLK